MWRAGVLAAVTFALSGCVSAPSVNKDIARAMRAADGPGRIAIFKREGERIAPTKFTSGNAAQLLRNGGETYEAMTNLIGGATRRIDMESYEFDEAEGGKFADMLIAKAAQGIQVNLIYDAWGSMETSGTLFERLRQGGVRVVEYSPIDPKTLLGFNLNRRDHRKLLLVDGRAAIMGGVNISAVYENGRPPTPTRDPDALPWRDTDIRVEGPIVGDLESLFLEQWREQKGPAIEKPTMSLGQAGDLQIQAVDGAPVDKRPLIYRTLITAISLAQTSVHLTTGFFVPTPDLNHALIDAARRGVDVELVVPSNSDSKLALAAGRSHYEDLLEAGVRIFERQHVVLHAKTAVIDGVWSTIGSSNLDWRSVVYNAEINAVVMGPGFGRQMEEMFQDDIARSKPINAGDWARRPIGERIEETSARVLDVLL